MSRHGTEKARDILEFVRDQPDEWLTPQGELQGGERHERMALAEKYLSAETRTFMESRDFDLETMVEANGELSRVEFCKLLSGALLRKPPGEGPGVAAFGGTKA